MLDTDTKIEYIKSYLSAYEHKLKLANSCKLFDSAKLFEIFAVEICNLWFGQEFHNLNDVTPNAAYVDLVSEDGNIFVQVSTAENVPAKIQRTFKKIEESKKPEKITFDKVYVFVLNNESVDKVTDKQVTITVPDSDDQRSSSTKIISFTASTDIITTKSVFDRVMRDEEFRDDLYALLKKDEEDSRKFSDLEERTKERIEIGKSLVLDDISYQINSEYEIDRTDLVSKIKSEHKHFICITGEAGSGKSAVCKKLLEEEPILLCARAEKFTEVNNLDDVWNVDISKVLSYLNKRVVFYIDALEFIADSSKTKLDILKELYLVASKYEYAYVVSSCRKSDLGAFMRIQSAYGIEYYEVSVLTDHDIDGLIRKYPYIQTLYSDQKYRDLLRTPFYINLIIGQNINISDIGEENKFRTIIYEKLICLSDKASKYQLTSSEVSKTVNTIVFNRAKSFETGVVKDEIDSSCLHALKSEGVISVRENIVRLKYDIYEDIVFEHYFDLEFDKCRGKYNKFFSTIEQLGRCVSRRYQIWISDKLFIRIDRDKFLYSIITSSDIPVVWRQQTEIGIVKSRHCMSFFTENFSSLSGTGAINEFIDIVNAFAFEARVVHTKSKIIGDTLKLQPSGNARPALINLLNGEIDGGMNAISRDDESEVINGVSFSSILKLCGDYAQAVYSQYNQGNFPNDVEIPAIDACSVLLEYCLEHTINEKDYFYKKEEIVYSCLKGLYMLSGNKGTAEYIAGFWKKIKSDYTPDNSRESEEIIEWTLKNPYPTLYRSLFNELCGLADAYLTDSQVDLECAQGSSTDIKTQQIYRSISSNRLDGNEYVYGLSEKAHWFSNDFRKVEENIFLINLYRTNFCAGFEWTIDFFNKAVEHVIDCKRAEDKLTTITVYFSADDVKSYTGSSYMWQADVDGGLVPEFLCDMLYLLKKELISQIDALLKVSDKELAEVTSNWIKTTIYEKSNNVFMLSVVEAIGMHFKDEFPGYAIELASSLDLVYWDIQRASRYSKSSTQKLLEQQILTIMNMPFLKPRHEFDGKCGINLQEYMSYQQLIAIRDQNKDVLSKIYDELDHLYSIIPDDEKHGYDILQVQKMDLRNPIVEPVSNDAISIQSNITGNAKKLLDKKNRQEKEQLNRITRFKVNFTLFSEKYVDSDSAAGNDDKATINKDGSLPLLLEVISNLQEVMKYDKAPIQYENTLITLISAALQYPDLPKENRNKFCEYWASGLERVLQHDTFAIDRKLYWVLFTQVNFDLDEDTKNKILFLMLQCIMYEDRDNGLINEIAEIASIYFKQNKVLAKAVFNTIVDLSRDDLISDNEEASQENVDAAMLAEIQKYLFNGERVDYSEFDANKYDFDGLSYIGRCGLGIGDSDFVCVLKGTIQRMIDLWAEEDRQRDRYSYRDEPSVYQQTEISKIFQKYINWNSAERVSKDIYKKSVAEYKIAINILFDGIDFSKFTNEASEFYEDIFGNFLCEYLDSFVDTDRRRLCVEKMSYLETKVKDIAEEKVRTRLNKALFYSVTRYTRNIKADQLKTSYSSHDKLYLNGQFMKYGQYHLEDLLETIYIMHADELLPDILPSVSESFDRAKNISDWRYQQTITKQKGIIDHILTKAFLNHSDEIKENEDETDAFENLLQLMIDQKDETAAVILDEFRVH